VSFRLLIGLLRTFLGFRLAVAGRGQGRKDFPPLIDLIPEPGGQKGSADQCCADNVNLQAIEADAEVLSDVGCCDALSVVLNPVEDCCADSRLTKKSCPTALCSESVAGPWSCPLAN
jgi:hypothetical protein